MKRSSSMKQRLTKTFLLTTLALLIAAVPALASDAEKSDPYEMRDDSWISLSGTVTTANPDSFVLDYGDGLVTVEMDDWDWYREGYNILSGDRVTVYGAIDDDLFESTTIEASSVYVESLNNFFYASAADEEDSMYTVTTPIILSETKVRGTVTSVSELTGEFTIDTGLRKITVETDDMLYDPLDDEGYQKIEVGDRVSVRGEVDRDLFEGRELVADSVITLSTNDSDDESMATDS